MTETNNRILAEAAFTEELTWFLNSEVRTFTLHVFERLCPGNFWINPASSTGKHHPTFSNRKPGGLVNHTKYVAWWGRRILPAFDFPEEIDSVRHSDAVLSACLLHDLMKISGDPVIRQEKTSHKLMLGIHGSDLAHAITRTLFSGEWDNMPYWVPWILHAVAGHMGRWTHDSTLQPGHICEAHAALITLVTHVADYVAAQKVDKFLLDRRNHVS